MNQVEIISEWEKEEEELKEIRETVRVWKRRRLMWKNEAEKNIRKFLKVAEQA